MASPTLKQLMKAQWFQGFSLYNFKIYGIISTQEEIKRIKERAFADEEKLNKVYDILGHGLIARGKRVFEEGNWDLDLVKQIMIEIYPKYFEDDILKIDKLSITISNFNQYHTGIEDMYIDSINIETNELYLLDSALVN